MGNDFDVILDGLYSEMQKEHERAEAYKELAARRAREIRILEAENELLRMPATLRAAQSGSDLRGISTACCQAAGA